MGEATNIYFTCLKYMNLSMKSSMSVPTANIAPMSPNIKLAPGAVVCAESDLRGDITIGAKTVIHPKAQIIAEAGPIIIGENNLIEEQVRIHNIAPQSAGPSATCSVMIIGSNNVFEVDSFTEAINIGDNNILEAKSHVGRQTELTNGCIVGSYVDLVTPERVAENTVVFGSENNRRVQNERPPAQTLQLEFLTKVLPNYHHLRKSTKGGSTR